MGLREDAIAAAEAAVQQRQDSARAVLASRLSPAEVEGLEVEQTTAEFVVFTDGHLHLAVRDTAQPLPLVHLVTADGNGGWTRRAEVPNLPALGAMLVQEDEPS